MAGASPWWQWTARTLQRARSPAPAGSSPSSPRGWTGALQCARLAVCQYHTVYTVLPVACEERRRTGPQLQLVPAADALTITQVICIGRASPSSPRRWRGDGERGVLALAESESQWGMMEERIHLSHACRQKRQWYGPCKRGNSASSHHRHPRQSSHVSQACEMRHLMRFVTPLCPGSSEWALASSL